MSQGTSIEWTDATWNPVRGCSRVSEGCCSAANHVVPANVCAPTPVPIEELELCPTSAGAVNYRIFFAGEPAAKPDSSLKHAMMGDRGYYLDVLGSIVCLQTVDVVNLLAAPKAPANLRFGDESVLVDVAANVGEVVTGATHEYVAIRRDRAATPPIRVSLAGMNDAHGFRVARSNP